MRLLPPCHLVYLWYEELLPDNVPRQVLQDLQGLVHAGAPQPHLGGEELNEELDGVALMVKDRHPPPPQLGKINLLWGPQLYIAVTSLIK